MKREYWIDWAKVVAIFSVVMVHTVGSMGPESINKFSILFCSSHIVLFFIVSGYLFNIKTTSFRKFMIKNITSLLIPYLFFNVLSALILFKFISEEQFRTAGIEFIVGKPHGYAGPAWFLLALFWIRIIVYGLSQISNPIIKLIAVLAIVCASYFLPIDMWSIGSSMMALPFFILGQYIRKYNITNRVRKILTHAGLLILSLLCLVVIILLYKFVNPTVDVSRSYFGTLGLLSIPVNMFVGLCLIFVYFPLNVGSKLLSKLSSGTIVIMGLHCTVMQCLWVVDSHVPEFLSCCVKSPGIIVTIMLLSSIVALLMQRYMPFLLVIEKHKIVNFIYVWHIWNDFKA